MATHSFSIATDAFDTNLLAEGAREVGSPAFREAVNAFLGAEFKAFGGHASIRVDEERITVSWDPETQRPDPMAVIVQKLQQGKQAEGIQLLELLLSNRPDDPSVLHNLGMALSDAGRLERAEAMLRRAVNLNPGDLNIQVALGVALGRLGRDAEAMSMLRAAIGRDPGNPWAQRNLGSMLLRTGNPAEAIGHFKTATRLLPSDQLSWLGLADAHRLAGNTKEAQEAYRAAVEINPHSDLAEKAREGSNRMAQGGFERTRAKVPRQDAVHYCLDALQRLEHMGSEEIKKLALELSMAGREGFAVHDPDSRYRVKGLDGEFSGLAMVCFMYVAMRRMAPGTDIGFDLANEYEQARRMFDASG